MDFVPFLSEVHPIPGSEIYSQFYDSTSHTSGIAHVPVLDAINSIANDTASLRIQPV